MKKFLFLLFFLPLASIAQDAFSKSKAQQPAEDLTEVNINENIQGTLLIPDTFEKVPLVIIIGDQGAMDRNGNERRTRSNAYQQLADSLLIKGIATYKYDKRILTQIKNRIPSDKTLFGDYIIDAKESVFFFKDDSRFSKIFIAGHGQGSLVAMLAVDKDIDGFISLNGAAQSIDALIVQQIAKEIPGLDKVAAATFEKVKNSKEPIEAIERDLYTVIGPQIQPFMKSWMQYQPVDEIKKLQIPILLINGSKNRQVDPSEAALLKEAAPNAQLELVENMNHVFKIVGEDEIVASKSYVDPNFPLSSELVKLIIDFVKN
ncbi:alpha/beta hydrolase [uncultured Nonlabens sp.]|uniref:alpha/beta hydrolase n=1 Tax=uncultured Nonlabens sp. TaxID=859306 RepID=UPI0030D9E163|tara:strand:- start:22297 stop:23250 length:954 start_codon:yes stop_codon:yes gene_type:complete